MSFFENQAAKYHALRGAHERACARVEELEGVIEKIARTPGIPKPAYNLAADALCWARKHEPADSVSGAMVESRAVAAGPCSGTQSGLAEPSGSAPPLLPQCTCVPPYRRLGVACPVHHRPSDACLNGHRYHFFNGDVCWRCLANFGEASAFPPISTHANSECCSRGALYCVLDHNREHGDCHDEDGRPAQCVRCSSATLRAYHENGARCPRRDEHHPECSWAPGNDESCSCAGRGPVQRTNDAPSEAFISGYNAGRFSAGSQAPYDVREAWATFRKHGGERSETEQAYFERKWRRELTDAIGGPGAFDRVCSGEFGHDLIVEMAKEHRGRCSETARPKLEWHEDDGPVLWWTFPVTEPPWVGTPLDSDWPRYPTHWTKLPSVPALETGGADK